MKKIILLFSTLFVLKSHSQTFGWAKSCGGGSNEQGQGVVVDANGNVYSTGYFTGSGDFDPGPGTQSLTSAGAEDVYISKLDASGNLVWVKSVGGTGPQRAWAIALDDSGYVYITGDFNNTCDFDPNAGIANITSLGGSDIFVLKLNSSGNYVWAKRMGGSSSETALSIAVDTLGSVLTTGSFNGTADFDPGAGTLSLTSAGGNDVFISKLNSNGNHIWTKQIGINGTDYGNGITCDLAGNVFVSGVFESITDFDPSPATFNLTSAGFTDAFVLKLNANGNFVWAQRMGSTSTDLSRAITLDASGNVLSTGEFQGTADFDPGAGSYTLTSAGVRDIYVSKLNPSGNFVWATQIGSTANDIGYSLKTDANNNVYVTGTFIGTVDFDPGAGSYTLTSSPSVYDVFILKLDMNGSFIWAGSCGSTSGDDSYSIFVDPSNNIYATGFYQGTVDFDMGTGTFNLTSGGQRDAFVLKLIQGSVTGLDVSTINANIVVFPNPATTQIYINSESTIETIFIYNLLGEMVQHENINSFSVENLPVGIYTLQIKTAKGIGTTRFVKQ